MATLALLEVDVGRYGTFEYAGTQAVAAAAHFLDFDGLMVPSARASALNLALFTERLNVEVALSVEDTKPVDWAAWRAQQQAAPRRQPQERTR